MSSSENGTAVTTRFIRTTWGTGAVLPSYSARILRASSSHSSLRNGYDGIAVLLRLRRSRSLPLSRSGRQGRGAGPRLPRPRSHLAAGTLLASPVGCPSVSAPIIPGAEPYSTTGDARGALVLHGFTGNPQSMRGLALALADAGFSVEMPLLPGHGTQIEDMLETRWADWSAAAETAYAELAARSDGLVVVGLSMGGMLSVWLAEHHPEIAAIAVVNPLLSPPDADTLGFIQAMIDGGDQVAPGIGSDIAMEGAVEAAYAGLPLWATLSLFAAAGEVEAELEAVTCPVLAFTSVQDHVVDPVSSEKLVSRAKGTVEQVMLERSFHVATLDWDKDEIEARTVAFAAGVLPPRP